MKRTALAILLLLSILVCFAACDDDTTVDLLDEVPQLGQSVEVSEEESQPDPPPAEGQTAMPVVAQAFNSSQTTIAILGTCEENAVVTASVVGGNNETVTAQGTVFAIELDVGTRIDARIQLTAAAPGKTESEPKVVVKGYDATTDGNLVYPTALADRATMFLKSSLDVLGEDVIRQNTSINTFTATVNNYVNTLNARGNTELIYVLMPSKSYGMKDSLPEGTEVTEGVTLYDQAVKAINESGATLIDMKAVLDEKKPSDYPLYYRTHSAWSEYAQYLTYVELMNHIAEKFPDAAPRPVSDFEVKEVKDALGGDLAYHFGFDTSVMRETVYDFVPKFNLDIGDKAPEELELDKTYLISGIKEYIGDDDYRPYNKYFSSKLIHKDEAYTCVDDTFGFYTERSNLPTAFFYRDSATFGCVDMLAERFNNCMFETAGTYNVNATKAADYAAGENTNVDYIVVMVSEENLPTLIPNNG